MMEESKKSLKIYFILVGILGLLSGITTITMAPDTISMAFGVVITIIAIMFFYYGIKLYDYLQKSPKTLINFLVIVLIINSIFTLMSQDWTSLILPILVLWYLIRSIKKLSS